MPVYDFYCPDCKITFEEITKPGQKANCPSCNKKAEAIFSARFSPRFKGSGFYSTDYKKTSS